MHVEEIPHIARLTAARELLAYMTEAASLFLSLQPSETRAQTVAVMKAKLQSLRDAAQQFAVPDIPPELSDLASAEYQDAFAELSLEVERSLEFFNT